MVQFACIIYLVLCQCGYGYPTEGEINEGSSIQNATGFISFSASINQNHNITAIKEAITNLTIGVSILIDQQHNSTANSSYFEELQGFAKKVVSKVKGGFNKVKNKVKVGIGKIKSKISGGGGGTSDNGGSGVGIGKIKSKISGGRGGTSDNGGSGLGTGTSHYRRPYSRHSGGGGNVDPTVLWVLLGLGIAGVLGTILYFMIKK